MSHWGYLEFLFTKMCISSAIYSDMNLSKLLNLIGCRGRTMVFSDDIRG